MAVVTWSKAAPGSHCASARCQMPALWHMTAGDVGSDYCEACRDVIEDHLSGEPDEAGDEYCEHCHNTGELDCHCGGDLCVCSNNGTYPCPHCQL